MNTKRIYALGFFDGVHLGHQALLRRCTALAEALGASSAAITFEDHPQSLFTPDPPPLLTTAGDRQRLLMDYGMEKVLALPVTWEVMSTPWEEFLLGLVARGAVGFVCGDDFRFGARGEGNSEKLADFCRDRGLPWAIVPEEKVDDVRVSSTYIRRQLETGDMEAAVRFLGHPFVLTGEVVHGQRLGSRLGFPTANLGLPEGLAVPRFGVYACRCRVDGKVYPAVTNVGTRPTVSGSGITVEPWILDYEGNLYGREITLEFYKFLRPEEKFPDLAALQREIRRNADQTREYLARLYKES